MGLEDLDPFALFDAEVSRLDRHFAGLDAMAWLRPSRRPGWTVRDLLAHLAGGETRRRDRPVAELLAEWRTLNAAVRRRLRTLGRHAALPTPAGPYPVELRAFHYAAEYATHADDAGVPDPRHPPRVRWRARVALFTLTERDAPVAVRQDGDGDYVVRNATAWATLTPWEFVAATAGRLPASHTLDPTLRTDLRGPS